MCFEQFFLRLKVFGGHTRDPLSLAKWHCCLFRTGFVLCDGQRLHLTLPFFALFSFLFRDRSRKKEAVVSRARGLDWSWTIMAVWADDNLDKDHGVRFQSPKDGTTCGGCFSEDWSDIIA